jgi:sugar O-acyltransferase (sialic acid O-acetyltransferase NeuD family)
MKDKLVKIGLIGFGSVGKQLFNTLSENGIGKEQIYIFDDNLIRDEDQNVFKFSEFKSEQFKDIQFIPTLGYLSKNLRLEIIQYLKDNNLKIFSFIHPTAFVSKSAKIGVGVIIYPLCNIDQGCIIEDGTIILNSSIVAHDSVIGTCSYLAPGVCVSGFVKIGALSFIGTSASIANNISIGRNATIAIGTCVTKDIHENSFVIGNPMQVKDSIKLI